MILAASGVRPLVIDPGSGERTIGEEPRMIDLFLKYADDPTAGPELSAAMEKLLATAGQGRTDLVESAERAVREAKPGEAFTIDTGGFATLEVDGHVWHAGRFETPTIAELRQRAGSAGPAGGRVRLWVLDGAGRTTDVGGLQATAPPGTLFQVASQFNCLEAPSPYIVPVSEYFHDYTQGPRASISAFPATLLRHYAAPAEQAKRFVQTQERQINLLADAIGPEVARVESGYLMARNVRDPKALVATLEGRFESIRVGVHEEAQVVLGYDFAGSVEDTERRRVAQVITSTVAGGGYGGARMGGEAFEGACRQLLRAAYLGTLLAAAALKQRRVVLTLIGGGVFGNPIPLIWDSILWAVAEAELLIPGDLDVIVNGRNLGETVERESIVSAVRERGGSLLAFSRTGLPVVIR